MKPVKKDDIQVWIAFLQGEFTTIKNAIRERGAKFFMRPIGMGVAVVFAVHHYIYLPSAIALKGVQMDVEAAKATFKFAEDYENLKIRLETLYAKLPRVTDPQNWLLEEVRGTLRDEGIVPLSTTSPLETPGDTYKRLTMRVKCQATYAQIASWISRLERSESLLLIEQVSIRKDGTPIGSNTADVTISTLVPMSTE
ncbi:MAG: hypothetical protein A2X36_16100 [Elusimicrobia bacterium GWA2_69_24]|nr:MAG: hypothetical protein A2X36_16100 [Elusimicrobia bacterium GWA2_69_24]HBL17885.1 hypothetical protein [Elusimicrobiota bacterium]